MEMCSNGHGSIVFADYNHCPLCALTKHNDIVHDFIESKGKDLVRELVAYQHKRNSVNSEDQQIQYGETPRQQLKAAIDLLNRWMDDPEENAVLSDTYHFICNVKSTATV